VNTLNPRSPLVVDTHELGRRAGSMRELSYTVPAPEGIGISAISVPAGSDIELDFRLESVVEGVLVTGTAVVNLLGECSRCLDPIADQIDVDLQELYRYPELDAYGRVTGQVQAEPDDDDDTLYLDGDLLDLEPILRDAVVLDLPIAPLCQEDCAGLCPECGFNRNEDPAHSHEVLDPRWAALGALGGTVDPDNHGFELVESPEDARSTEQEDREES
jgi:uncharacterized protein